jgi:hypothetical protein
MNNPSLKYQKSQFTQIDTTATPYESLHACLADLHAALAMQGNRNWSAHNVNAILCLPRPHPLIINWCLHNTPDMQQELLQVQVAGIAFKCTDVAADSRFLVAAAAAAANMIRHGHARENTIVAWPNGRTQQPKSPPHPTAFKLKGGRHLTLALSKTTRYHSMRSGCNKGVKQM